MKDCQVLNIFHCLIFFVESHKHLWSLQNSHYDWLCLFCKDQIISGSDGNPPLPFLGIFLESGDLKGDQLISRLILALVGHNHKDTAIFGNRGIARPGVIRSAQVSQFAYTNIGSILGIQ